jgi:hypothetical protein
MSPVGVATDSSLHVPRWAIATLTLNGCGRPRFRLTAAGLAGAILTLSTGAAFSHGCMPNHPKPLVILKDMGPCRFDPQNMSFAGEPVEQAKCLMRGMDASRNLVPTLESLPPALASRIGRDGGLPAREVLSGFLSKQNLEWDFAAHLWQPLSQANDNDPDAPMARYFVIHDTSGPNYGRRPFPADVDTNPKLNNLANFKCPDGWGVAHVVVNRMGDMLLDHDFSIPWRETKFERAVNFNGALKGLFVHTEMIQPRRSNGRGGNDAQTPDPSFTTAQYERLALLYIIASARAGHWLIPAFHAAIDGHIPNGHDDPLNFHIDGFADSLDRVMDQIQKGTPVTAIAVPDGAAAATPGPDSAAKPMTAAAEINPSTATALVKPEAPAQRSAQSTPQNPAKTKRQNGPKLAHVNENGRERTNDKHEIVLGAEHCKAVVVKGHSRRVCWIDRVETRGRQNHAQNRAQKHGHVVRSVDRRISQ